MKYKDGWWDWSQIWIEIWGGTFIVPKTEMVSIIVTDTQQITQILCYSYRGFNELAIVYDAGRAAPPVRLNNVK